MLRKNPYFSGIYRIYGRQIVHFVEILLSYICWYVQ